jgi:hypothetical protein
VKNGSPFGLSAELEAQLPQFFERHGPGSSLPGRYLSLHFVIGDTVKPDYQNAGGEGCGSQQAHDESANRPSRLEESSKAPELKKSIFRAARIGG